MTASNRKYVLAFDTANEVIAIGVGLLNVESKTIEVAASAEIAAHRASNTQLLPQIDALFAENGICKDEVACVCVGRGPGSFTGVRIAMATAKGIASALGVALIGISTQEAVAYGVWLAGVRGSLLVLSDAMRKEVYPSLFDLSDGGAFRKTPDRVVKAAEFEKDAVPVGSAVAGDALSKYAELFEDVGRLLPKELWTPSGAGLLKTLEAAWQSGEVDPFDCVTHDPIAVLPIYTRLSDAEENERAKLAVPGQRNLKTGVQGAAEIELMPFDVKHAPDAAAIEAEVMGTDAWNESLIADELPRKDRTWWMALRDGQLVGYAGGMIAGDDVQLLKVAVHPDFRRKGIAKDLVEHVAYDAENLAASSMSLEVRGGNEGAIAFYEALGFANEGTRPRYYSDGEGAVIMKAPLPLKGPEGIDIESEGSKSDANIACDGAALDQGQPIAHPLILAIESSCDETAAAVVDGNGQVLSSVVASQIDFHARFGGVVPEIASRKHVEAIVGVCRLALEEAGRKLGMDGLTWQSLDAVGVTYAPGLVGALVVGVAFAKGAAWAAGIPIIAVNHLEGHLYANKLAENFQPPAVVSLVSGGNTMLVHMRDWQEYDILGTTIDDAVGEAFDKVAKALGLPYPGGPIISKLAAEGNPDAVDFPRALMHSGDYRFSLSGLKTAVITYINQVRESGEDMNLPDICASFQQAVIDVQVSKTKRALDETGAPTFCLGGGVAANPALRSGFEAMCKKQRVQVIMPPLSACGDNAAMIALVALDRYKQGNFADLSQDAFAHADLSQRY